MTREELTELIHHELWSHPDNLNRLIDKLWPVLAQVWAEGHDVGWDNRKLVQDGQLTQAITTNPYGEVLA